MLYFDWLIGEESEPGLADVPHQLVFRVEVKDVLLGIVGVDAAVLPLLIRPVADGVAETPLAVALDDVLKSELTRRDHVHPQKQNCLQYSPQGLNRLLQILRRWG